MQAMNVLQKMTLGEVATVEKLSGLSIVDVGEPGTPLGKFMAAIAYVWRKRTDPGFTFEDALNLPMDELNGLLGGEEPDPTELPA